jgi:hypothetical protein
MSSAEPRPAHCTAAAVFTGHNPGQGQVITGGWQNNPNIIW